MEIEFDPAKSERNARERGLPFDCVYDFDFETAVIWQDVRKPYPEVRWVALGFLDERLHCLCFARVPAGIRVISLRKANDRERKRYEQVFAAGGR